MQKQGYSLGIVGSRYYNNYAEFSSVVNQILSICAIPTKIVSGGHTDKRGNIKPGTDTLAWKWATENNIEIVEHNAEWDKYGRAAGPIRNKSIVKNSDVILAFVLPNSVGTINTISLAQKDPSIRIYTYNILEHI
uniref:DNA recombination-mediator protein A n=1 Tax=Pithovirus LCPAC302 TaxID=2506593 RepID=A0A481Z939_9VIRU|nr:MAG: DNA recombination-mediator protein A [Pithovirus LCPAC302]